MTEAVAHLLWPERFERFWPEIEKQLRTIPHLWQPWWTLEAIRDLTLNGTFQCWTVGTKDEIVGVAFSRINTFPTGNVFYVWLAFGEGMLEMSDPLEAAFEKFARDNDCHLAEISGRPGWEPFLRKRGFKRSATTMMRFLEPMKVN